MSAFDDGEWRQRRKCIFDAIIDRHGIDFFKGKKVLELGCGYGHLGEMFHQIGSDLICLEGRLEHVESGRAIFPHLNFVCSDLDSDWLYPKNDFDVILHIGTLYHLERPEVNLSQVCISMKPGSIIILETEFVDSDDKDIMLCLRRQGYNLSVREYGCRPSHGMIEDTMRRCGINFNKMITNKYDFPPLYLYSVPRKNDGHFDRAERGFWFGTKV